MEACRQAFQDQAVSITSEEEEDLAPSHRETTHGSSMNEYCHNHIY